MHIEIFLGNFRGQDLYQLLMLLAEDHTDMETCLCISPEIVIATVESLLTTTPHVNPASLRI